MLATKAVGEELLSTYYLLTAQNSQLRAQSSELTAHISLLTAHSSQLTAHSSQLTVSLSVSQFTATFTDELHSSSLGNRVSGAAHHSTGAFCSLARLT